MAYGVIGKVRSAIKDALDVTAVTDLLAGQSANSIYWLDAGSSPTRPYILIELTSGGDLNESPTRQRDVVYAVKAIAATASAAEQIDEQIDAQLHGQSLTITGWETVNVAREDDLAAAEDDGSGGTNYVIGGQYRIRMSQS